jgi:light-regulated signal transduction histidine kinase (bacteriophytochrome)
MKNHLYPSVDPLSISVPPQDGSLFLTPEFCRRKADSNKCKRFYNSISNIEGFHICPFGFTAFVHRVGVDILISTALRIEGHMIRKNLKHRIMQDLIPKLTELEFDRFLQFSLLHIELNKQVDKTRTELNEVNQFMQQTFHEIRKLNRDLKSQSEEMNINIDRFPGGTDKDFFKYRIQNVYATSALVSIRLDAYDLISNPLGVTASNPISLAVYKKFEKVKHCLDNKSKLHKVDINFKGNSYTTIPGYEIFELLPYVLFENALKYSPENQNILVEFSNQLGNEIIKVTNVGPRVEKQELETIFEKNKRGRLAAQHFNGTGIGLYFAKQVCDIHGIKIQAASEPQGLFNLNNIPYTNFIVTLTLPRV